MWKKNSINFPMNLHIHNWNYSTHLNCFFKETVLMESKGSAMQLHQYLMWPKKSQCRYVETKYELLLSECRKELEDVLECDIELNLIIKNKKNMVRKDYGWFCLKIALVSGCNLLLRVFCNYFVTIFCKNLCIFF